MVFNAIVYGAGVLGGLVLIAVPFTPEGRVAPRWTRIALWIAGPAGVLWGCLGYTLLFDFGDGNELVRHFKTLSAGAGIGILLVLLSSGELGRLFKRRTKRP